MKEMSGIKMQLVKVANKVIDSTNMGKRGSSRGSDDVGHLWVSLARYDDELIEKLESWERRTRDQHEHMGRRKPGTEHASGEDLAELFSGQTWDKSKMVRSFARMGTVGQSSIEQENSEKDGKVFSCTLRPLSDAKWARVREKVEQAAPKVPAENAVESETTSIMETTQTVNADNGIIVDAGRELRVKLYMGQVFMGWIWFIPMFHMAQPAKGITRFLLTRKEVDFPLGVGSAIIDVEISLEACEYTDTVQPPARQTNEESHEHEEPTGVAGTLQAIQAGGIGEAVEVKQAAEV
jgi:phosphatidylinositol-3,4,5-trisphosphate 3-phosphatase/dual-specificity protein phosphatase PTEN